MGENHDASVDFSEESEILPMNLRSSQSGAEGVSLLRALKKEEKFQSARVPYIPNRGNSEFMEIKDEAFFTPPSLPIVACGVFGGLLFAAPCGTPMTAVAMNLTGGILMVPIGGWLSSTLVGVFMTTFTFAIGMQGYERGVISAQTIKACLPWGKSSEKVLSAPIFGGHYRWKIGYNNCLVSSVSFMAGTLSALLPTTLLPLVWAKNYPDLILPFVFFLFLRKAEESYTTAKQNINDAFEGHLDQTPEGEFVYSNNALKVEDLENAFYTTTIKNYEQAKKYKAHLLRMSQQFQIEMEKDDCLAKDTYKIIKDEVDKIRSLSINEKEYFAVSALLGKHIENEDDVSIVGSMSINRPCLSKLEDALTYMKILLSGVKILCKGASTLISTPIIVEYGLESFAIYLFPNSWVIRPLAYTATALISISNLTTECLNTVGEVKAIKDYKAHKVSLPNCRDFFRSASLVNGVSDVGAVVPAGICTLIGVSLGLDSMARWELPMGWQGLVLTPYVINEFPSQFQYLGDKLKGFLIATVTTIPETVTTLSGNVVGCLEKCVPEPLTKSCCGCLSSYCGCFSGCCGRISKYIPGPIKEYASLWRSRCWLRNWSDNLHNGIENIYDTVTNASLYFTTQTDSIDQYYDEGSDGNYYYNDDSSMMQSEEIELKSRNELGSI